MYIGRYLCNLYYTGTLKPSSFYKEGSSEYLLSQCVEKTLEKKSTLTNRWLSLLCGDTRKLNKFNRQRFLGGGADLGVFDDLKFSIDGGELCMYEIYLYQAVEKNFRLLCENK